MARQPWASAIHRIFHCLDSELSTHTPPVPPQVGCAYGALFLATGSVACSALAHSLANIASGALWRAANPGAAGSSSSS